MKKSLIALAVLAAAGAVSAQTAVSLTGAVDFGYQSSEENGVTSKGTGVDTSEIHLTVTEDLGAGLKLTATMGMEGFSRTADSIDGMNQTITLSGGFGSLMMGAIEIGDGIRGLASAGAPVNNMEGEILPKASDSDIVKYTSPSMGGFKLSGSLTEGNVGTVLVNGFGTGLTTDGVDNSRAITVGADYAAGPVAAKLDYSDWTNNTTFDSRYRIAGSYDLGVAKFGLGYEDFKHVDGTHDKYAMLGVSAPLGAFTVGMVYIRADKDANADVLNGYSVGASYALSKRTSIDTSYSNWEDARYTTDSNKFKLVLAHSF